MSDKMKVREGKDGYSYPYTSPDLVVDETGKSNTTKFNEVDTQFKDIAKQIESGNIGNNVEPQLMDMPRIYFSEGTLPTTKTATTLKFDYYSKTAEYHGWAEIKCQGNSSMSYPKKNFTIKLFKDKEKTQKLKIDFKGWGKQSKFVLKANWIDITHARNIVSARIWGDIVKSRNNYNTLPELLRTSPNQGAIDGFPIIVYGNGYYQGRYTLNIPKDKWMSNMDDTLDTHCILCGENYGSGCFRALPAINGSDWTDELHDVVPATIKTSWTNVIKFVMNSSDAEFKANLNNYIDVNSLIDYLLYAIMSTGLDAFGKNQIYMTYNGTKWFASMYDMDSTWGLWWNGSQILSNTYSREQFEDYKNTSNKGNLLYVRLQKLFINEIKTRYAELRQNIFTYPYLVNKFEEFVQICPSDIVKEDYASTTANNTYTGIPSKTTNNIQQLRSNINARLTYVDGYINNLIESKPCIAISLNKTELTFTGAGSSIPDEVIDITKNTSKGYLCRASNHVAVSGKQLGEVIQTTLDTTTDFIPCNSTNTFTVNVPQTEYGAGVVAYDVNKNAIKTYTRAYIWELSPIGTNINILDTTFEISNIPENTAYIRMCFNLTDLSSVVVTKKYSSGSTSQEKLIATVTPTDTTDKIIWSVNPTGICTVEDGVVTPIKNDACVITATCGNQTATCNVTVTGTNTENAPTNLLNGISPTMQGTNLQFNNIELQPGLYDFKNINGGSFIYLGGIVDGENLEPGGASTNGIRILINNADTPVTLHAFPNNIESNTADKLGLYKVCGFKDLANRVSFTKEGDGYFISNDISSIYTSTNDSYGYAIVDPNKKYRINLKTELSSQISNPYSCAIDRSTYVNPGSIKTGNGYILGTLDNSTAIVGYFTGADKIWWSGKNSVGIDNVELVEIEIVNNDSGSTETPDVSNAVYTLPQATTFNGTSDFVDTDIALCSTDQDYTIFLDVTSSNEQPGDVALLHCMHEEAPYPGIAIMRSGANSPFFLAKGNPCSTLDNLIPSNTETKLVITRMGTTVKAKNNANINVSGLYTHNNVTETLLLGCYQDTSGNKGRYFTGTIHQCKIWRRALTDDEVSTLLS